MTKMLNCIISYNRVDLIGTNKSTIEQLRLLNAYEDSNSDWLLVVEPEELKLYQDRVQGKYDIKVVACLAPKQKHEADGRVINWILDEYSDQYEYIGVLDDNVNFGEYNPSDLRGRLLTSRISDNTLFKDIESKFKDIVFILDKHKDVNILGFPRRQYVFTGKIQPGYYSIGYQIVNTWLVFRAKSITYRVDDNQAEDYQYCLSEIIAGNKIAMYYGFVLGKDISGTMKGGSTDSSYADGDIRTETLLNKYPEYLKETKIGKGDNQRIGHQMNIKKELTWYD